MADLKNCTGMLTPQPTLSHLVTCTGPWPLFSHCWAGAAVYACNVRAVPLETQLGSFFPPRLISHISCQCDYRQIKESR